MRLGFVFPAMPGRAGGIQTPFEPPFVSNKKAPSMPNGRSKELFFSESAEHDDTNEGTRNGCVVFDAELFLEENSAPKNGKCAVSRNDDHTDGEITEHDRHIEDLTDGFAQTAKI